MSDEPTDGALRRLLDAVGEVYRTGTSQGQLSRLYETYESIVSIEKESPTMSQPDRLTPSEARYHAESAIKAYCKTVDVDEQEVLAALASPTPGEEIKWHGPEDEPEWYVGDRILGVVTYAERGGRNESTHLTIIESTESGWEGEDAWSPDAFDRWAYERDVLAALTAQPASPPPTQGWEEALRFLEAEAFAFEEDHEPPSWCGHCGHPYRDEPDFKHEPYCPVAKRLATLRSHLSGSETPQTIDLRAMLKEILLAEHGVDNGWSAGDDREVERLLPVVEGFLGREAPQGWSDHAWQPIETANKDYPLGVRVWNGCEWEAVWRKEEDGWVDCDTNERLRAQPTHWRPDAVGPEAPPSERSGA